ncbi:hypothetical protein ATI61_109205 [Archangium gephyra]|uniref:NADH-ubiquinone oxidoreductase chain 6 n=1 Tax=Archangium gephyra TaxID=48 RepID=A0AAC8Q393_9BACT|nr:hypothetical protein [Archangium gephyra]AKI99603.1 NADH-ubiquinone oxidoreductase chain 6 [Archangium gephyra]REG27864.1 hypothetical protein ATI61_109205 [Archangium gephyra]
MKKSWLIHPFLLASAPILFLLAHNIGQVEASAALAPLGVVLSVTAVLLGLTWLVLRQLPRAAMLVSLLVGLFYVYGHVFHAIQDLDVIARTRDLHVGLGLVFLGVLVTGARYILRTRHDLMEPSRFLTLLAGISILFSANGIYQGVRTRAALAGERAPQARPSRVEHDDPALPDVYHIILDGYAREDVLKDVYQFDNSGFTQYLRDRGFFVADRSVSNYPLTFMSVASTLNMRYLDDVVARLDADSKDHTPFYDLIHDHAVGRFFQSKGYRYVHFNTNYGGTETSRIADQSYQFRHPLLQNEFTTVLLRTYLHWMPQPSVADLHLYMLDKLEEVPRIEGPTYTLFHLLMPHNPYVFDRHGNIRANIPLEYQWTLKTGGWAARQQYIEQMIYLNGRIQALIEHILATSKHPPIIIVHGDHGSASTHPGLQVLDKSKWGPFIHERTAILNAYYVPDEVRRHLYPSITPVNSFRLLLKHRFGANLEPLEDRSFITWYEKPFDIMEVTDQVLPAKASQAREQP